MPTIADHARYPLMFGPSPVHPLDRLSDHLGGARIWAKREDCNSGLAYGGNKVRKLEYLVPEALAQGADTLVSIGGYQSNHTRQVAAVAAKLGMKAVLVQEKWVDWPDSVNDRVGNIMLSRIMGAEVRLDPAGFDIGFRDSWTRALEDVKERGGTPYAIPAGASDHPLGGLGFANWAHEVAAQGSDPRTHARATCLLELHLAVIEAQIEPHVRVTLAELGQQPQQIASREGGTSGHPHQPGRCIRTVAQGMHRLIKRGEPRLRMMQEGLPFLGQCDGAGGTVEQAHA